MGTPTSWCTAPNLNRFCETCFLEKPYFLLCHSEQSESTLLSFMSLWAKRKHPTFFYVTLSKAKALYFLLCHSEQSEATLLSKTKALAFVKDRFLKFTPCWSYLQQDLITYFYSLLVPLFQWDDQQKPLSQISSLSLSF